MNTGTKTINTLFKQLGLDSSEEAIRSFLHTRAPLPKNIPLYKANIWNESQAMFLKQSIEEDSEWSYLVDQLDSFLR